MAPAIEETERSAGLFAEVAYPNGFYTVVRITFGRRHGAWLGQSKARACGPAGIWLIAGCLRDGGPLSGQQQQNERSALCLLALLNLTEKVLGEAEDPLVGITTREHYGKRYAMNAIVRMSRYLSIAVWTASPKIITIPATRKNLPLKARR